MIKDHKVEPKRVKRFTDPAVKAYRVKETRTYWAPGGLGLRVSSAGTKSWRCVLRVGGRQRWITLGQFPKMSVAQAYEAHGRVRTQLEKGLNPADLALSRHAEERGAPTVRGLCEKFIELYAKPGKKTWRDDERLLTKEVVSVFGSRRAADIRRRDILALLDTIVARGTPILANRVLAVLRKVYNWGISRDIVDANPCWQVHKPGAEHERERFLSTDEIRRFLLGIDNPNLFVSRTTRYALRLVLATGCRPGEAAGASWTEFDLDSEEPTWTIPAERTKTHHARTIPLSPFARHILAETRLLNPRSDYPFPGPGEKAPMRPLSLATGIRRNLEALKLERFTPHDLRRSCATNLAALGHPRVVIAAILGHTLPGVTRIYDRHGYTQEQRAALDAWGLVLERLSKPEEPRTRRKDQRA